MLATLAKCLLVHGFRICGIDHMGSRSTMKRPPQPKRKKNMRESAAGSQTSVAIQTSHRNTTAQTHASVDVSLASSSSRVLSACKFKYLTGGHSARHKKLSRATRQMSEHFHLRTLSQISHKGRVHSGTNTLDTLSFWYFQVLLFWGNGLTETKGVAQASVERLVLGLREVQAKGFFPPAQLTKSRRRGLVRIRLQRFASPRFRKVKFAVKV